MRSLNRVSVARRTSSAMDTRRPSLRVSSAAIRTSSEYSSSVNSTLTARFLEDNLALSLLHQITTPAT